MPLSESTEEVVGVRTDPVPEARAPESGIHSAAPPEPRHAALMPIPVPPEQGVLQRVLDADPGSPHHRGPRRLLRGRHRSDGTPDLGRHRAAG